MKQNSIRISLTGRFANFFGMNIELITMMFLIRVMHDIGSRIFIPFIPQLSSGLGLTITAFGWLLALRSSTGLFSPVIGILADRYGRRFIMVTAFCLRGLGFIGLAFSSGLWSALPFLLISFSTSALYPVLQAYVSDQASYERRGRALAVVDSAFSTATVIGLPIVGWMIDGWGWQLPILVLAVVSFIAALVIVFRLPKTPQRNFSVTRQNSIWKLLSRPNILASVFVAGFIIFNFILFTTFWGLWLSQDFGFGALEIGLVGTSIGIAELAGILVAGLFIDRIGKRRGSLISLIACSVLFAVLTILPQNIFVIRIMLILIAFALEFAITASIPLFAEQAPEVRATVFSFITFGSSLGFGLAPPVATMLWDFGGEIFILTTGAIFSLTAFFLVSKFLHDRPDLEKVNNFQSFVQ